MMIGNRVVVAIAVGFLGLGPWLVRAADPKGVEFFEKKIRPVLAERCYSCHSAEAVKNKKLKGGLTLDTRDGLLKGGDSGPALVPGKAKESLIYKSLCYDGDVQMPPKGKLPDAVLADFETWINQGAADPRGADGGTAKVKGLSVDEGRKFWAYRQPVKPAVPAVADRTWGSGDLDAFILARLEEKKLKPAADADRIVLVRRVYYDLVGLPPTPDEVESFVTDRAPDAYEKLVDRLLASPHFGERWGRHWLDVARFGESLTLRGFVLKEAWRYRDYVIDSLNADVPFDRFVREQIAGDLLPSSSLEQKRRQLIATTFLTLGNTNLEEQDKKQLRMDAVDEQLDTISRGFLAQTVTCARCHDHKFDPIPTRDYYALAGILRNTRTLEHANVSKWLEVPLPAEPAVEKAWTEHQTAVAALQKQIQTLKGARAKATPAKGGVLAIKDVAGIVVDDADAKKVGDWTASKFSGSYIGAGYSHDGDADKGKKTITFQPAEPLPAGKYDVRLAYVTGGNRAREVPVTVFSADGEKTVMVDQQQPPPLAGRFVSLGQYQFERNGQGFVIVSNEDTKGYVIADAVVFLPVDKLDKTEAATPADKGETPSTRDAETLRKLEDELKKLTEKAPNRDMVMTIVEEPEIEDARIHIRGIVHNLGAVAPRGFLQVAMTKPAPAFSTKESGRRELADWLASKDNPLTARVLVNRAWHWLFGSGLVRTMDNFGTTGETPSHPELLDYLSVRFVEDGWSLKKLVRLIVLSRTYRLSVESSPEAAKIDPENRLLAHRGRRRLEAECIRDTILVVSGQLQLDRGGPTFKPSVNSDYGYKHSDTRRSVYAPVFRNSLPELFEAFDFADPSVCTGQRNVSTVAPQALFMMNNPFVLQQARHAARRLLGEKGLDDAGRLTRAYRLTLGRAPDTAERRLAEKFLTGGGKTDREREDAWAQLVQVLFASVDFRYVN